MLRDVARAVYNWGWSLCPACGRRSRLRFTPAMWEELGRQWELTPELYRHFDQREGSHCGRCGASLRSRQLAQVLLERWNADLGTAHTSLRTLAADFQAARLRVAEINAAGNLHQFLDAMPGLQYSEFGSQSKEIRSENIEALTYEDGTFDYVLTSDTLEHVPNFASALAEIHRVLKIGGYHIFTIPVVWDRRTRARASYAGGQLKHHLTPSYHGSPGKTGSDLLVFHEFGGDVRAMIEQAGFDVEVIKDNENPALFVFVARRA